MRPDFWFGMMMVFGGLVLMSYGAWPKKDEPKEIMTLLLWGPPEAIIGSEFIYGGLTHKQALDWKVWQPTGWELKRRIVIDGKIISAEGE